MSDFIKRGSAVADDIVTRLRLRAAHATDDYLSYAAADEIERLRAEVRRVPLGHITTLCELEVASEEIERLRAAGDALADLVRRRLPHHGWTTADRGVASVILDAWEESRRG